MTFKQLRSNRSLILAIFLIAFGLIFRLLPHPANIAPIGALAIFAGAKLPKKWALTVPLGAMILSDIFIGFHNVIAYTWGTYALIALLSNGFLRTKQSVVRIAGLTLSGAFLFFAITNFGVWLHSGMYAHTLGGLVQTYVMALPFYQNSLIGDIGFTVGLFGLYEIGVRMHQNKRLDNYYRYPTN